MQAERIQWRTDQKSTYKAGLFIRHLGLVIKLEDCELTARHVEPVCYPPEKNACTVEIPDEVVATALKYVEAEGQLHSYTDQLARMFSNRPPYADLLPEPDYVSQF